MAYVSYADRADYFALFPVAETAPPDEAFRSASRHVDSLTFNRIVAAGGVDGLTAFQQEVVKEVVCRQAAFETENADLISSVLSSYSINGVSVQFGSAWNVLVQSGVAMQRDVYALLEQTGLCWRGVV